MWYYCNASDYKNQSTTGALSFLDPVVVRVVRIDVILLELPGLELGLEHEIKLLVATSLGLRHAEEGPDQGKEGPAEPEESRLTYKTKGSVTCSQKGTSA